MTHLFKKYQEKQLTPTEMEDFEKNIINQGFDYLERRNAWKNMIEEAEVQTPVVKLRPRLWTYGIAASITALIAFGLWYWVQADTTTTALNQIAMMSSTECANYYLRAGVVGLGETKKGDNDYNSWEEAFKKQDYKAVIQLLDNKKNKSNQEVYYLAWANYFENKKEQAQSFFKVASEQEGQYSKDALWYYALLALTLEQKEAAYEVLDIISKDKSDTHSEKAVELLKKRLR